MPNYRIVLDPGAAGGPVEISNAPDELSADDLYAIGQMVAAQRESQGWVPCAVEGIYRTDMGTLIDRPEPAPE